VWSSDGGSSDLRLRAVHVEEELRLRGPEARVETDESRLRRGLLDDVLGGALQPVEAEIAAILHVELEPARAAEPLDRRCTQHHDLRFEDLAQLRAERRQHVRRLLAVRNALLERRQD